MQRQEFLRRGLSSLGLMAVAPMLGSCTKDEVGTTPTTTTQTSTGTTNGSSSSDCSSTPSETEGPFPTKTPSSLAITDITSDRTGIKLTIDIAIKNKSNSCNALQGAIVDIWHCDKDGYYSEYGGSGMQSVNMQAYHFLRGRQVTDANGVVKFTSIFPGWYSGRAPHIHVHVYNAAGKSLLVTQIAFPKTICDTVYTTATNFYTRGTQDTTNEKDNVFSDGFGLEMSTVSGSVAAGYALTHSIVVSA